jgi:hypothetical protein
LEKPAGMNFNVLGTITKHPLKTGGVLSDAVFRDLICTPSGSLVMNMRLGSCMRGLARGVFS